MAGRGISGLSVALASAGGIAIYAGLRGVSIVQAVRDIGSGKPAGPSAGSLNLASAGAAAVAAAGLTGGAVAAGEGVGAALTGQVAQAATPYMADVYSQTKRRQQGYSDCSSFVYKIMRDIGRPPTVAWSNTTNYHLDPRLVTVPTAQAREGDLALSAEHVVILTGSGGANAPAIGQQNSRENVRVGTVTTLMPTPYVIKRYTGGPGNPALVPTGTVR